MCVGRARYLRRRMSPGIVPWNRCLEHNYTREIVRLMTTLPVPSNRNTQSHSCTERHAQLFLPPAATVSVEGGDACAPEYPGTASCKSADAGRCRRRVRSVASRRRAPAGERRAVHTARTARVPLPVRAHLLQTCILRVLLACRWLRTLIYFWRAYCANCSLSVSVNIADNSALLF
uniref:Uncharacterized protein n=1 Tax=Bombyx mori TaxID=7091 RepID=A0A8R2LU59_BOMMO|nr:uncharacterized protein LOC119628446 [Bombyx mori]